MIETFKIDLNFNTSDIRSILNSWSNTKTKIIHLQSDMLSENVRKFYEDIGNKIGKFCRFAEDANINDRNSQRTNNIWMEVRYDSKINDAYRHSSNPQPFHTDGSYIKDYPNATLMCCVSNSAIGGETTFLLVEDLIETLEKENPDLLNFVMTTEVLHERSGDERKKKILELSHDKYIVNWNYYCVSKNNNTSTLKIIEMFFNFLNKSEMIKEKTKSVKLVPGDAVFWKDSEILHGRNGFVPKKESDRFLWKCAINIG